MRFILVLIIILSGMSCIAQNSFSRQIREIVNDTNNHFKTFQGAYNKKNYTFDPKFPIKGTINGKIYSIYDDYCYYMRLVVQIPKTLLLQIIF